MAEGTGFERHLTAESKDAKKTTEFRLTVVVILLILISAFMIKGGDSGGDEFIARQAWLYVAILTGAYSIGRGFAKSGVREYPADLGDRRNEKK